MRENKPRMLHLYRLYMFYRLKLPPPGRATDYWHAFHITRRKNMCTYLFSAQGPVALFIPLSSAFLSQTCLLYACYLEHFHTQTPYIFAGSLPDFDLSLVQLYHYDLYKHFDLYIFPPYHLQYYRPLGISICILIGLWFSTLYFLSLPWPLASTCSSVPRYRFLFAKRPSPTQATPTPPHHSGDGEYTMSPCPTSYAFTNSAA